MRYNAVPFVFIHLATGGTTLFSSVTVGFPAMTGGTTFVTLFAIFLYIPGSRAKSIRGRPQGLGKVALRTCAHCVPFETRAKLHQL